MAELNFLRRDLLRLWVYSGSVGVFILCLLDTGFVALLAYRLLRAWRLSCFHVRIVRALFERIVELFTKIHLPSLTSIGPGLLIIHGHGIVINGGARIGANVTIYHRVTIGVRFSGDSPPVVGDDVAIGCGAAVLGPVCLPRGVRVPANSVVTPRSNPEWRFKGGAC